MKTKKVWILVIIAIAITGLVVGLSVYFKKSPSLAAATTNPSYITSTATKTRSTAPVCTESVTVNTTVTTGETSTTAFITTITTTTTIRTTTTTTTTTITTTTTKSTTTSTTATTTTKSTTAAGQSTINEAVLMLSTREQSNIPMVIGLSGEFKLN